MDKKELINTLKTSGNSELRWEAATELSAMDCCDDETIEAFACGLQDSNPGVKDICSRLLSEIPDEYKPIAAKFVSPFILQNLIELRNLAGDILIKIGAPSIEYMIPFLDNPDYIIRQFACDVIGRISDSSGLSAVYSLLGDENSNVVNSAIEAIGNIGDESSFDVLVSLYGSNEDLKPSIMEAIGKIGSQESENFLLEMLKTEDDIFLKTAAIDALAFCANNILICDDLMNELGATPKELQPILLKTIYAIATRNEAEIELPAELRPVAYNAIREDEKDIVGAGLVSLGYYYYPEDIPALIHIVKNNHQGMQMHILTILLAYSDLSTIRSFFEYYFENTEIDENQPEFLSYIDMVWENVPLEKGNEIIKVFISICFLSDKFNRQILIEILYRLNPVLVAGELSRHLAEGSECAEDILDMAASMNLVELRDAIAVLAESNSALSTKAAEVLEYLN